MTLFSKPSETKEVKADNVALWKIIENECGQLTVPATMETYIEQLVDFKEGTCAS